MPTPKQKDATNGTAAAAPAPTATDHAALQERYDKAVEELAAVKLAHQGLENEVKRLSDENTQIKRVAADNLKAAEKAAEEAWRNRPKDVPRNTPGAYYRLRPGHVDPQARDALEVRYVNTPEALEALDRTAAQEKRPWYSRPYLIPPPGQAG